MKAITYHRYGPPEIIRYSDIEKPQPAKDEVLIRVCAASVNPYDWHFLRGKPAFVRIFTGLRQPKSPRLGADVAGYVEANSDGAAGFKLGDAVYGTCKGSFAEYACAPVSTLALKPANLSFAQAAAVPIAAITALQGLRDVAGLQTGQSVLINGAAGGVGTFAVQLARWLGAAVTGVCSTRNLELVRSLGASQCVDYTCQDFATMGTRYDVIFDLVGNRPLADFRRALAPRGVFIGCGGGGPDQSGSVLIARMLTQSVLSRFASQRLTGVLAKVNPANLNILRELIESGIVTPAIDRTYPLSQTRDAIRYLENGHARGKVVISVDESIPTALPVA